MKKSGREAKNGAQRRRYRIPPFHSVNFHTRKHSTRDAGCLKFDKVPEYCSAIDGVAHYFTFKMQYFIFEINSALFS